MRLKAINERDFAQFGQVIAGYDFSELLKLLSAVEPAGEGITYVASCPEMEATQAAALLRDRYFGGLSIQLGYCIGSNTKLNCLEYHRCSEVNIFLKDTILLLGRQQDIIDCQYDVRQVQAFFAPAFSAVELFGTTLHYVPCDGEKGAGFRTVVALPVGTNLAKPEILPSNPEDKLLFGRNKWLLTLPGTPEAEQGAFAGLVGKNIDVANMI